MTPRKVIVAASRGGVVATFALEMNRVKRNRSFIFKGWATR
jgi:hypothetical protein